MQKYINLLPSPLAIGISAVFLALSLVLSIEQLDKLWVQIPLLLLGLILGLLIVQIDKAYLHHLYRTSETEGLVTQSLLFLGMFFPVSFFVVTSTGSILGGSIIVGFLASTTATILSLRSNKPKLEETFFYQLKRPLSDTEVMIVMGGMLLWNAVIWIFALL